jgi:uncharacterized protein YbaR (Trm112 family)
VALPDSLIAILVCPKTKQPLVYFPRGEADRDEADAFLFAPSAELRYRIEAGVPVLLVEEAEKLSADQARRLLARAQQLGLVPA